MKNKGILINNILFLYNNDIKQVRIEFISYDINKSISIIIEHNCESDNFYNEIKKLSYKPEKIEFRDINDMIPIYEFLNINNETDFYEEETTTINITNTDFGIAEKAKNDAEKIINNYYSQ